MSGVLAGVRVVEIAGLGPGPFCGMHLADLGADVICVERPGALSARTAVHRGKRSVTADLRTEAGRDLVLALVAGADALIEGMRPGAMERLGLGPTECRARNARLVYGRVTGWGQHGPLAQAAGHDNNFIALSGALYFTGTPEEPPSAPLSLLGDVAGGALYLAIGLLSGILHARSTGLGTVVDAAMVDGSAHMLQLLLGTQLKGMTGETRGGNMHDSSHFFGTFRCADGEFITLASMEPAFYRELLERMGLQDNPAFAEQWERKRWPEQKARMVALFASRTRAEWCELLEGSDVCFAPVLNPQEAARHPHNQARGTFFTADEMLQAAPAPRFLGVEVRHGYLPGLGEHSQEIQDAVKRNTCPWR